jgi:hypothetical protein
MKVEVLYLEGCPHWRTAADRLVALQAEMGYDLEYRLVATPEEAEMLGFRGSPTIRIDGVDRFSSDGAPIGFTCRVYQTPEGPTGSPTVEQLRTVMSR